MAIVSAAGSSPTPLVVLSPSGTQTRIAFNAALSNTRRLDRFLYVLIDVDADSRVITFTFCRSKFVGGHIAYRVGYDGGAGATKKTATRAVYVSSHRFPLLVPGRYPPRDIGGARTPTVSIECEPGLLTAERLDSYTKIRGRFAGVYALFDESGEVLDYGHSTTDIRSRVRDQWVLHQPAAVAYVQLPSGREAKHWERAFHKRHIAEFGSLPRGNPVIGPGCGCQACGI